MKLIFNVLAGAALCSVMTLSAFAQYVPVRDGSNSSRAPFLANRPNDCVRVIKYTPDSARPVQSVVIATHLGGPVSNQLIAVNSPATVTPTETRATSVARAKAAARIAAARRE